MSKSLSARRAWIEIDFDHRQRRSGRASLSARRAWIEIAYKRYSKTICPSLSARRAWIEIIERHPEACFGCVALRKESVDRNLKVVYFYKVCTVALRKESVDRNHMGHAKPRRLICRSPQGERG